MAQEYNLLHRLALKKLFRNWPKIIIDLYYVKTSVKQPSAVFIGELWICLECKACGKGVLIPAHVCF